MNELVPRNIDRKESRWFRKRKLKFSESVLKTVMEKNWNWMRKLRPSHPSSTVILARFETRPRSYPLIGTRKRFSVFSVVWESGTWKGFLSHLHTFQSSIHVKRFLRVWCNLILGCNKIISLIENHLSLMIYCKEILSLLTSLKCIFLVISWDRNHFYTLSNVA